MGLFPDQKHGYHRHSCTLALQHESTWKALYAANVRGCFLQRGSRWETGSGLRSPVHVGTSALAPPPPPVPSASAVHFLLSVLLLASSPPAPFSSPSLTPQGPQSFGQSRTQVNWFESAQPSSLQLRSLGLGSPWDPHGEQE